MKLGQVNSWTRETILNYKRSLQILVILFENKKQLTIETIPTIINS